MKRNLKTSNSYNYKVRICQSELESRGEFPANNDVFNVMDFMSVLISNLNRDLLAKVQNLITSEIIDRTCLLREMIPDEIWMNIFRMLAKNKDISKVFPLREVNKRWYSWVPDSLNEAKIDRALSIEGIRSIPSLHCLIIETPCKISKGIVEKCFSNIQKLSLQNDKIQIIDAEVNFSEFWTGMTKLHSLGLSDNSFPDSLINFNNFSLLTNLLSLKVYGDQNNFNKNSSSAIINVRNLSRLVNLTKLNNWNDKDLTRETFEARYGPNYEVLGHLKSLKIAKLQFYEDYINCEEIQRKYPHIRFKWFSCGSEYASPRSYEGEFLHNACHGKGILTFSSGSRYEGEFSDDQFEGKGTLFWFDGERYEGEWKNGKEEGKGIYSYGDGHCYEGEFKNGEREGRGVITYPNGDRFEGEFKDGEIVLSHGFFFFVNGDRYEGEFLFADSSRDLLFKEGKGIMIYSNGDRYEGMWKNDKREGKGSYIDSSKNKYLAEWENDKKEGPGIILFASGGHYEGDFKNDKKEGKGTMVYPNGDRYEGEWKNDEKV